MLFPLHLWFFDGWLDSWIWFVMVKSRDRNAIDGNALNSGQTRTSKLNERDGFLIFYLARKYGIKEISMKWVFTLS